MGITYGMPEYTESVEIGSPGVGLGGSRHA